MRKFVCWVYVLWEKNLQIVLDWGDQTKRVFPEDEIEGDLVASFKTMSEC